jgi:hypothetical protein
MVQGATYMDVSKQKMAYYKPNFDRKIHLGYKTISYRIINYFLMLITLETCMDRCLRLLDLDHGNIRQLGVFKTFNLRSINSKYEIYAGIKFIKLDTKEILLLSLGLTIHLIEMSNLILTAMFKPQSRQLCINFRSPCPWTIRISRCS